MVRVFIDTSSDYLMTALTDDNIVKGSISFYAGRKMNEELLYQFNNLLESLSYNVKSIDEFYAGVGPGSFTGVRIGVAMVQGLAVSLDKKAYGISSLDIKALSSGLLKVKTASLLKGSVYAVRKYDFETHKYSDFMCEEINDNSISEYLLVNTGKNNGPDLVSAIKTNKLTDFRLECMPIYLRKSEAEINLDKICNNR